MSHATGTDDADGVEPVNLTEPCQISSIDGPRPGWRIVARTRA